MKYPIFKVKFLQENIIEEKREMAHSIRLEKLCHMLWFGAYLYKH